MSIDVLFLAWNRLEYTLKSFVQLVENTDWSLVERLVIYDDGSEDGTRELLQQLVAALEVKPYYAVDFRRTSFGSPVAVMNDYVATAESSWFAKIDNDIVVPPGWLNALMQVAGDTPHLQALGMEAGRTLLPPHPDIPPEFRYGYTPARHIGGVGLIRTEALGRRPQMHVNGRFGWTEFQEQWNLNCAWINPDLLVSSLDRIPEEPWISLTQEYFEHGWLRNEMWPKYHERWMCRYWHWWSQPKEVRDEAEPAA